MPLIVERAVRWARLGLLLVAASCGASGATGPLASEPGSPPPGAPAVLPPAALPATVASDEWGRAKPVPAAKGENFVAYTDPGELPRLEVATDHQQFPLEHTHVKAALTGFVAEVEVRQTYQNPHDKAIEAVYVFPLPENSAVHQMRMEIGKRVIEAKIEKRAAARRIYERAKAQGHTAALLEQERPNVFTQSVANIEPHTKIDVVIRYVQDLTYDAGEYEFVFPMVVGPRYFPGAPLEGPQSGSGTKADTTRVPDASRVSPPIIGKGERTGHDISLELTADAGDVIGNIEAPTHEVSVRRPASGAVAITLTEKKSIPNRDFVLRYRVAGAEPKATLYTALEPKKPGFFSLIVQPPALDVEALVGRREIIFVVDVSGSMSGTPLAMCKDAMREALAHLRPVDTFNIVTFAGASKLAFPAPRPANTATLREAFDVIDRMEAGGGTEMANAVDAALSPEVAEGRHRYVFFMTDGYVGNEAEIIDKAGKFVSALEHKGQRARVFGFGVGSSVNRYLIDGVSGAGKGIPVYATNREDPTAAVNRFYHYIDRAVLTNVSVDWGGTRATDVHPSPMPDLFASHPIIVHGRLDGPITVAPTITAKAGDRIIKIPVSARSAETASGADSREVLGLLWARSKVATLERDLWDGNNPGTEKSITQLGLDFHLVTRFTSFVAVDTSLKVAEAATTTVVQPVEQPEGVDVAMAGGVTVAPGSVEAEPANAPPAPAEARMEVDSGMRRGCGCRTARPDRTPGGIGISFGLAMLFWLRRRARRRTA